jgi:glycosyltransferase involved in cell wall biosynthesis
MRIINTVFGDATGGRWQVVLDYTDMLRESGHEVLVLLNSRRKYGETPNSAGGEVEELRSNGHYDPIAVWSVRRLIKKFKPDVIIAHCSRSISILKRAAGGQVPVVAVTHSNKVTRSLYADAYFNISTHIDQLVKEGSGASSFSYHIPNMVLIPAGAVWEQRQWQDPVRIGALGRFDKVKGLHVYVEALGLLKAKGIRFSAILGGSGEQEAELRELVRVYKLKDELELVGWVSNARAFFNQLDVLCIPALSDAFGLTPLEAAIASLPIVASTAEGHLDMFVHGQHALFAEKGDAQALADSIEEMVSDFQRAETMSKAAFDKVTTNYNRQNISRLINQALTDLTARFGK